MIELRNNSLSFAFPSVHEDAACSIEFQRTLRIPDDNNAYPLPPGLGNFPVQHVDDYAKNLPALWRMHGGVFIPMYQSEALWVNFSGSYPCAVKVAAGKINAVSGDSWSENLAGDPQNYVVLPEQPWLDGFNVDKGYVRQFVAMPLGDGFSAEEQLTGVAEHGGLQVVVYPMKAAFYNKYLAAQENMDKLCMNVACDYSLSESADMGLAPGGLMRQKIYDDEYGIDAWDQSQGLRCFIHLANSEAYKSITGKNPPHKPTLANDYENAGLPWFEHYSEKKAMAGSTKLAGLSSVAAKTIQSGKGVLSNNGSLSPKVVVPVGDDAVVRDGEF